MSSSDQTSRAGVHAVATILTTLGWAFREQPTSDFGIDAQAERLGPDGAGTGKLIALQIKSGRSHFRKRRDGFVYYGKARHRRYWTTYSLPVFIVLHDPEDGLTLWQRIEEHLIEDLANGRWAIQIPADQRLDAEHLPYIERGIASDFESVRRHRLALDLPLIARFAAVDSAILRVEEWVNKTLNFRGTAVVLGDDADADPDFELDTWLPAYTIGRFMDDLFPWLQWSLQDYVDASEAAYEVAYHILEVRVNEIGRSALLLDEFYRRDPVPDESVEEEIGGDWWDRLAELENYAPDDVEDES